MKDVDLQDAIVLLDTNPTQAVMAGWQILFEVNNANLRRLDPNAPQISPLLQTATSIAETAAAGKIPGRYGDVANALFQLFVRTQNPTPIISRDEAVLFIEAARGLLKALNDNLIETLRSEF